MRIMKIKIESRANFNNDLKSLARSIDKKKLKKKSVKKDIFFESLTAVRKILTDNRLDVWRTIRDQKPESITHLAELLNRGFRPVHRDVMLLRDLGMIELTEGPGRRGNVLQLVSLYDELVLAVA
jgi:predicted transcriptional regulator